MSDTLQLWEVLTNLVLLCVMTGDDHLRSKANVACILTTCRHRSKIFTTAHSFNPINTEKEKKELKKTMPEWNC